MTRAVILLLGWSVPGALSALQLWLLSLDQPTPLTDNLVQIPPWWLWAAATPALMTLADRRPLLVRGGWRNLPWHVAACLALDVAHAAAFIALARVADMAIGRMPLAWALWIMALKLIFIVVLAYAALIAIHHALALRRARAALETQLARAQLDALRLQIRPHFLFNTLNTIAMQIRTGAHAAAGEMLSGLGALLRATIDDAAPEITLERELAILRRWLEIEQARFGDRLRVAWDIAPDCERARVPAFLLQPLVENALHHGLGARPEGGELRIRARCRGGEVTLEILDDGEGLAGPVEPRVGLANVRDRLARLYPGAHTLAVTARDDGRGTRSAVTLPFREASDG